jgi:hypothetical protein
MNPFHSALLFMACMVAVACTGLWFVSDLNQTRRRLKNTFFWIILSLVMILFLAFMTRCRKEYSLEGNINLDDSVKQHYWLAEPGDNAGSFRSYWLYYFDKKEVWGTPFLIVQNEINLNYSSFPFHADLTYTSNNQMKISAQRFDLSSGSVLPDVIFTSEIFGDEYILHKWK